MPPIRKQQSERSISITRPRVTGSSGLKYKFRCSVCGKLFSKTSHDPTLGEHKNKSGSKCFGRHGISEGQNS